MATALNLTAPLKQDPESQRKLAQLAAAFSQVAQPAIDAALAKSNLVHFARVVVIDDKYIQVLTEFDGDPEEYTEFFRRELPDVFRAVFDLVEGAPPWEELDNRVAFRDFTHDLNRPSLGTATVGNADHGYLFSAVGDRTVLEIKQALGEHEPQPAAGVS
jgi:hypothetical protein